MLTFARRAAMLLLGVSLAVPAHASFEDAQVGLTGVHLGSAAWGDYDGDGDLDLLLTGETISGKTARIYRNTAGSFTSTSALPASAAMSRSAAAWGDFDGDGDLDLALAGSTDAGPATRVYRNAGGSFVDLGDSFLGLQDGALAWGDYDNDGDLDLAATGSSGTGSTGHTVLYRNTGSGFVQVITNLQRVLGGSLAWGDYDGDGDLDLVVAGSFDGTPVTNLYRNDGGSFIPVDTSLPDVRNAALDWGDFDNDGDLDLVIAGWPSGAGFLTRVYRNNGGSFADIGAALQGIVDGTVLWGDFENDGDLDLALAGNAGSTHLAIVYRNDGGVFTNSSAGLPNAQNSAIAWGDFDRDTDLDLALAGYISLTPTARVYRNVDHHPPNDPPIRPAGLSIGSDGSNLVFEWNAAFDPDGGSGGLTYNLRVGSSPGSDDLMPSHSSSSGVRLVARRGNVDQNTSWRIPWSALDGVPSLYWSVQSIDQTFTGSSFASEQIVPLAVGPGPTRLDSRLDHDGPNPFQSEARLLCALPRAMRVAVTVHDVAGRRVRSLTSGVLPAGRHRLVWTGEDDRGAECGAGLYFVKLHGEGVSASLRILKLR